MVLIDGIEEITHVCHRENFRNESGRTSGGNTV